MALLLLFTACASGEGDAAPEPGNDPPAGEGMDGGGVTDASSLDGGTEAGTAGDARDGSGPSASGDDGGGDLDCPEGRHACGATCAEDRPNTPAQGCRLGCGGPCPEREGGRAICTDEGRCDIECIPPAEPQGGGCSCAPVTCESMGAMCGTLDDGCGGELRCGSCGDGERCDDGACVCGDDDAEPNDSHRQRFGLPAFSDHPDSSMTFELYKLTSAGDEDWFAFEVIDGRDVANPNIDVTLDHIPDGSDYDLALWYVCTEGDDNSTCDAGEPDDTHGRGCVSATPGSDAETVSLAADCDRIGFSDAGTAIIRVSAGHWRETCEPYRLRVDVH